MLEGPDIQQQVSIVDQWDEGNCWLLKNFNRLFIDGPIHFKVLVQLLSILLPRAFHGSNILHTTTKGEKKDMQISNIRSHNHILKT